MINKELHVQVPENTLQSWQEIVDILADLMEIPAALIMRLRDPDIEVLVSSQSAGNPYHPGDKDHFWGSGLYCETAIKTRGKLLVPNAMADPKWMHNPDVKLNMISYLGFPIGMPDGSPFGTICVLDNKENHYSEKFEKIILKFRSLVESNLETIFVNQVLGDRNKRLTDYLEEIQALRGIVPICANCKSIRDEDGNWHPIEKYLIRHPEADFSHGICPTCMRKLYPEYCDGS